MDNVFALPLVPQNEYTTTLTFALPMCVIRTEPKLRPWEYENFVNVYITGEDHGFMYDGFHFKDIGEQLFINTKLYKDTLPYDMLDIPAFLIHHLGDCRFYIDIRLDEYYLSSQEAFQEEHFFHSSLLYGYDLSAGEFLAYTIHNRRYTERRYPFEELTCAFLSAVQSPPHSKDNPVENEAMWLFRLKRLDYPYPFSVRRFTEKLMDYAHGTNRSAENYTVPESVPWYFPDLAYGIDAVNRFCGYLDKPEPLTFDDFKDIHFLYEQKKGILARLRYISALEGISPRLSALADAYKDVVERAEMARGKYLKCELQNSLGKASSNALQTEKPVIARYVRDCVEMEEMLLPRILEVLKCYHIPDGAAEPDISGSARKLRLNPPAGDDPAPYPHQLHLRYAWSREVQVERLRLLPRGFQKIVFDSGYSLTYTALQESAEEWILVPMRPTSCRSLDLHLYSQFPIDPKEPTLQIHEVDLARGARMSASSCWPTATGMHDPDKAVDGDENTFWSAGPDWRPGEYLEIQFSRPTGLNCVLIRERPQVGRLREYAVEYTDATGRQVELLRHHGGLKDRLSRHEFPRIITSRLRLVIYQSAPGRDGCTEPAVARFEAYDLPALKQS